jgi:urea carboxylase-associated protein 2
MSQTATTHGARDHARAMGGTTVTAMPTIPARAAVNLPSGVGPGQVTWDEIVAAGGYASKVVRRGTAVQFTDLHGDACAHLLLHRADQPGERLNVADTVKVQWQAYLGRGTVLLSDMGRALATIVADTSGRHDAFCGGSNRVVNDRRYGDGSLHQGAPNARDRFVVALTKHGLSRRDVGPNVSFFKGVRIDGDGALRFEAHEPRPMARVTVLAELDLLVTVVNVVHVLDPRDDYVVTDLRLTAWDAQPTGPADPQWTSTPERERAYLNSEDLLAGAPG